MLTVLLLFLSNIFMTFAWYGFLKRDDFPLMQVIFLSWGIAFFEYCLMVPANRLGYQKYQFSAFQLKILQEFLTLTVFLAFALFYLKEAPRWNHLVAFALIMGAVYFGMMKTNTSH